MQYNAKRLAGYDVFLVSRSDDAWRWFVYRQFLLKTTHLACSDTVSAVSLEEKKALQTLESVLPKMAQLTGG